MSEAETGEASAADTTPAETTPAETTAAETTAAETTVAETTALTSRWSRLDGAIRREILVGLALLLSYGLFQQVPVWNEYSRYDLVRALAENGTTQIDPYRGNTGDTAFFEGHYYSDKPPGSALLGVPVYLALTFTSNALGTGTPDPLAAVEALAFVVSGVFTVLLVLLLLRFLRPYVGERWAFVISLGYGLGSMAFPFATMLFGHAASSFFLFAAFYLLWRWRVDAEPWRPMLAGFLAGWAVLTEIPTVLGVAILALYALWLGRGVAARFVAGGIPLLLVMMGYDWVSFGGPFNIGYQYATNFGEQNRQGIVSVVWPSFSTTLDLLIGPRGLVRLAPWFAFAPLGLLAYRQRTLRAEIVVAGAICVAFLTYNSGALNPFGGWTPGPRYLLPALPFAAMLVALAPAVLRPIIASLIAVAAVVFFVATVTMPNAPELYADPLFDLWLPRFLSHEIAQTIGWLRWGMPGVQPLLALVIGLGLATAGILATFRATAERVSLAVAVALAVLIVAFAFPLWPVTPLGLGVSAARPAGSIAIAEVGVTPVITRDIADARIWAQLENIGPAIDGTRVVFTVFGADGTLAWSSWHANVSWRQGERQRLAVDWDTRGVSPGDYRVGVSIVSEADQRIVFANAPNASVAQVLP